MESNKDPFFEGKEGFGITTDWTWHLSSWQGQPSLSLTLRWIKLGWVRCYTCLTYGTIMSCLQFCFALLLMGLVCHFLPCLASPPEGLEWVSSSAFLRWGTICLASHGAQLDTNLGLPGQIILMLSWGSDIIIVMVCEVLWIWGRTL